MTLQTYSKEEIDQLVAENKRLRKFISCTDAEYNKILSTEGKIKDKALEDIMFYIDRLATDRDYCAGQAIEDIRDIRDVAVRAAQGRE